MFRFVFLEGDVTGEVIREVLTAFQNGRAPAQMTVTAPALLETPAKKKPGRPPKEAAAGGRGPRVSSDEHRQKVLKYLEHAGTAKPAAICEALGIASSSLVAVLDHAWFSKGPFGVRLAEAGKREVGQ